MSHTPGQHEKQGKSMSESSLTDSERECISISVWLWNAFCKLPEQHPSDRSEFATAIHQIQNMILARPWSRTLLQNVENNEIASCPVAAANLLLAALEELDAVLNFSDPIRANEAIIPPDPSALNKTMRNAVAVLAKVKGAGK